MMKATVITRSVALVLITSGMTCAHAAATWTEARNDAMGGTGVASSNYTSAALVNPALLTHYDKSDDIGIILPAIGAQVSDPNNLQDGFDNVKNAWDQFSNATTFGSPADASARLKNALQDVSGHDGRANAGASAVIAVPNATLPFALVVKGWGQAKASAVVTDHDIAWLDSVQSGQITPTQSDLSQLTSRAQGTAALVSEYGIAMAHKFTLAGTPVSVGITPKLQRVDTWNYNVSINNYSSSDFHSGDWKRSENGANVDIGFAAELTPNWTIGLTGQNLVSRNVRTREVNNLSDTFQIRPQATLGTAWSNGLLTLATDVDLTPSSGFASDKKAQYAGIGAELNAWSWAQLRAGYRADMRNSNQNVFTAGVGLSPFNLVHFDVTGMAGTNRNYGAAAQLSFTF